MDMVGEAMSALHSEDQVAEETRLTASASVSTAPDLDRDVLQIGVLSLDREKRLATVKSNPPRTVELTEGEMSILVALMEHPNQVLSCNQLADVALGYEGLDKWTIENMIRSSVFRLRQKIEASPDQPHLICTVRGRGYFFSPA
jgi:two-component system phosphate regulon response regulator OmpR